MKGRKIMALLACVALVAMLVTACSSKSIQVENMTLTVGDVAEIKVTFNPSDSVDAVNYTVPEDQADIVSIKNGNITALKAGEATVTCTTANLSTTFTVTVKEKVESGTAGGTLETFNENGTFENGLTGWNITGETASLMTTEADEQNGNASMALKLWTGAAIDFTAEAKATGLKAGTYTLSYKLIGGALDKVTLYINDEMHSTDGGGLVVRPKYETAYYTYELKEDGDITVKFEVQANAGNNDGQGGWGYLDDVKLEEGNTVPEQAPQYKDYVVNSGFEDGTSFEGWTLTGSYQGELTIKGDSANNGLQGVNYWGDTFTDDVVNLSQQITGLPQGDHYKLTISVIADSDTDKDKELKDTYLYITHDGTTDKVALPRTGWNSGNFTEFTIDNLSLSGDVEVGLHIEAGVSGFWMYFDDLQLLNMDEQA